ncbi:MAG TPA: hypothetical protein VM734_19900 [Kofleriaceae bacterium]|nr:hypothetical protein [Kofleriaceae bacterium]
MSPIRSRLALVVLVSAACSSRSPSVAPATVPPGDAAAAPPAVSLDRAEALGRTLAEHIRTCAVADIAPLLDLDRMLGKGFEGHDIPAEHRDAFIEGAKSGAQSTSMLCNPSRLPDRVELLRVRMIDGAARPLIRSQKGDWLDYLELELGVSPDGEIRVIDVYIHSRGIHVGQLMSQAAIAFMAPGSNEQLAKVLKLQQLIAARDRESVERLWAALPGQARAPSSTIAVAALTQAPLEEVRALVAGFREQVPDDPSVDLAALDAFIRYDDVESVSATIDRIDRRVGGDWWLEMLRAGAYLQDPTPERLASADRSLVAALARKPGPEDELKLWRSLLGTRLKARDYDRAVEAMIALEDRFGYVFDEDKMTVGDWRGFLGTPAHAAWKRRTAASP